MGRRHDNPHGRELLGLDVEVTSHTDPGLVGRTGRIVNETRETILVSGPSGRFQVAKRPAAFTVISPVGVSRSLQGSKLAFRSQDRVKKGA